MSFPEGNHATNVVIHDNTFYNLSSAFLGSIMPAEGVTVSRNLFVATPLVGNFNYSETDPSQVSEAADYAAWFEGNVWEFLAEYDAANFQSAGAMKQDVQLLSRDRSSPDYLRPVPDEKLPGRFSVDTDD